MDAWLAKYAELTEQVLKNQFAEAEGSGAAGGLGFALISYLNAVLCKGAPLVMEITKLEEKIKNADILITGEGKFDHQSYMGKAPFEAARLAKLHGKIAVVLAGSVSHTEKIGAVGIDAVFPIVSAPCSLVQAMEKENAYQNLKRTAEQIFRLISSVQK